MIVNNTKASKLKVIHHFDIDSQNIPFCNDICLAKCKFLDAYMVGDMQLKKVRKNLYKWKNLDHSLSKLLEIL